MGPGTCDTLGSHGNTYGTHHVTCLLNYIVFRAGSLGQVGDTIGWFL